MAAIVYQTNKKTGFTYAYESISYWDKEKKQSRARRIVFVPALKKNDFAGLDWYFRDGYMNTLLKVGAEERHMVAAEKLLSPLVCDNDCNRSVQGTLNQMVQELGWMLECDNASVTAPAPYRTGAWLAERPCTAKGVRDCIWPVSAMLDLLEKVGSAG
ncbi:MAG TPA: hypothetical protein ENN66_03830 [Proteobacteria bacterium]|nr:hypothetical protein [Pseudomonadota bacterium]